MVEELSAKCHQGEPSNKSSNLVEVHVPREKREYTTTLTRVELHGKETLEIVSTSKPDKDDEVISRLWRNLGGMLHRIVGVGVHYTNEDEPPQMAGVLQLPKRLNELLQHETLVTFAGFSIESDKEKLKLSGLEINPNKFIDIQRKWRVPYTRKEYDSLTDVAASVIHPFYKGMEKNINTQEEYKLWGTNPLPDNLIEYAGVDAYAPYKARSMIDYITDGSEFAKEREAAKFYDHPYCPYTG
ncbi:hypothetical protein VPH35_077833 [Triticum aestivum]